MFKQFLFSLVLFLFILKCIHHLNTWVFMVKSSSWSTDNCKVHKSVPLIPQWIIHKSALAKIMYLNKSKYCIFFFLSFFFLELYFHFSVVLNIIWPHPPKKTMPSNKVQDKKKCIPLEKSGDELHSLHKHILQILWTSARIEYEG